jgi:signal transduction histidine kinase
LLNNAFKFTTKGSIRVTITRNDNENKIVVKVKDTGIGIHPDIMPKLFTKFATKSDGRYWIGSIYFKEYNRKTWWKDMG